MSEDSSSDGADTSPAGRIRGHLEALSGFAENGNYIRIYNYSFCLASKRGSILTKISDPGGFSCRVKVEDVDASLRHHLNMRGNSTTNRTRRKGDPCCRSLSCVRRVRSCACLLYFCFSQNSTQLKQRIYRIASRVYLSIQQRSSWCPRIRPGSDLHVPSLELAFKELEHMLLIHRLVEGFLRGVTAGGAAHARVARCFEQFKHF